MIQVARQAMYLYLQDFIRLSNLIGEGRKEKKVEIALLEKKIRQLTNEFPREHTRKGKIYRFDINNKNELYFEVVGLRDPRTTTVTYFKVKQMEKLYAFRHKITADYLLEGNGSDRVCLNMKPEYFTNFMSKPDMWQHYGLRIEDKDGKWNLADPSDMEVVEYFLREHFFVALPLNRAFFTVGGHAQISIVNIPVMQWDEENDRSLKDENEDPIYKDEPHVLIELNNGSLNYGWSYPTEEGYHSEEYLVYEGVDHMGQPIWLIDNTSGGRDCDGRLDSYNHYMSRGGKQILEEKAKRCVRQDREPEQKDLDEWIKENRILEYCSPMWDNPHRKNSQRDYTAESMGY